MKLLGLETLNQPYCYNNRLQLGNESDLELPSTKTDYTFVCDIIQISLQPRRLRKNFYSLEIFF